MNSEPRLKNAVLSWLGYPHGKVSDLPDSIAILYPGAFTCPLYPMCGLAALKNQRIWMECKPGKPETLNTGDLGTIDVG